MGVGVGVKHLAGMVKVRVGARECNISGSLLTKIKVQTCASVCVCVCVRACV